MTDPFTPAMHSWIPPKLSTKEATALKARWDGLDPMAALGAPPFGRTADGRIDLRYLPLRTEDDTGKGKKRPEFNRAQFRNCDFTGASMHWLLAEHSIFENCVFDRTVLTDFNEKGNTFSGCSFVGTDMRLAGLGSEWNNSKPGEYESVYRDCLFQDVRTAKLSVDKPVFINCRFVFKRLKTVDWRCAGFWGCRFEGAFEDMIFYGQYLYEEDRARKGCPPKAGLHATSFRDSKLRWIDLRCETPLEQVEMPADGDAFIADTGRITADLPQILAVCPDEATRVCAQMENCRERGAATIYSNPTSLRMRPPGVGCIII